MKGLRHGKTLREEISRHSQIIKNPAVFSLDYVPEEIYERPELQSIRNQILNFLRYKIPHNTLLIGPSGTGKTLSVLKYRDEIHRDFPDFEVKYVNCREAWTSFSVIKKLASIPVRGISLDDAFQRFFSQQSRNLLLILDEIDRLRDHEILYALSRTQEIRKDFPHAISLFLVSNNPYWKERLESSIASSLRLTPVTFGVYNAQELVYILRGRVEDGLWKGVCGNEIISYIAAKTTKEAFSDARVAIITLFQGAQRVETERCFKISIQHVNAVFEKVNKDLIAENLSRLNFTSLLILYSCVDASSRTARDIHGHYQKLSHERGRREPVKYVQFLNNLSYLQAQNLVQLWKTKVKNYFITEIELIVPAMAVRWEFEKRLKEM